eukprot:TRINITY_DN1243_c0_g2_i1.p1 TRINITY_DN1243_c0_g2~~TRINITY_DN1243_c0_g2_i1.p1  ORF type:complete len:197 (+),score=63.53 TRINITY_DN1243_c0_g2_i1:83-673(+)
MAAEGEKARLVATDRQEDEEEELVGVAQMEAVPTTGNDKWATGLFDCLSNGGILCANVFFCTPCMVGRVHSAVQGVPHTMDKCMCSAIVATTVIGNGVGLLPLIFDGLWTPFVSFLGCVVVGAATRAHRMTIRKKYGISGNAGADCALSYFCSPCVTCQHHTELVQRGVDPGLFFSESSVPYRQIYGEQPGYPTMQ